MIPFPGESAPLDWANVTAGSPFADEGDAIRHRDGSATLAAGDVFVAGFFEHHYLEAGADVVFSAVVETLPGSAGTLALSGGPDAAWTLTDGPSSVYDLGTHVVSGAETVVVPLPWVTVADYLAEDVETAVRVACVSGAVVVQQVKLRIWPAAGIGGGWSAEPFVQDPQELDANVLAVSGVVTAFYDTQAAFRAVLALAETGEVVSGADYVTSAQMYALTTMAGTSVSGGFGAAYIGRSPGFFSEPGVEGESWIVPPAEVWTDKNDVIFQAIGADEYVWSQGDATIANDPGIAPGPASGMFHIDLTVVPPPTASPGTPYTSLIFGDTLTAVAGSAELTYSDVSLPEFDGDQLLRVTIWHDGHFGDILETGGTQLRLVNGTTSDEVTFDRLRYVWTPAPVLYWNPGEVPPEIVEPLRLIQRGDGLGMGSGRILGSGTRQNSPRVFGSL